jgi:general secretion pathway protein L
MTTLILSLPFASHTLETLEGSTAVSSLEFDFLLTHDGQRAAQTGRATAALLPASAARNAEVVLVLPVRAVSWHTVLLPTKVASSMVSLRADASRVRSVLTGAMEDFLLDEPDRVHFAAFALPEPVAPAQHAVRVAVCNRAGLQAMVQVLEKAGYRVTRIVAEFAPLNASAPVQSAVVHLVQGMEPAQMVLCTARSVAVLPLGPAAVALAQAYENAQAYAEPAVLGAAEQAFGVGVQLLQPAQRLLQAVRSEFNLAQGELRPSQAERFTKALVRGWQTGLHAPAWRPVRWGLAALLLTQVVAVNALAYKEKALRNDQRAAVRAVLLQTFPQVRLVVDAPVQMQRELDLLAQSRGAGASLGLAQALMTVSMAGAQAGAQTPVVDAIEVVGDSVRLQSMQWNDAVLQPLRAAFAAQGCTVQLQGSWLVVQPKGVA